MPHVNFRISSERLAVMDSAVKILGVGQAEFLLRSSEAAAIDVLNERPIIALDDQAWDDFVAVLDAPVEIDPAVKACYARRPRPQHRLASGQGKAERGPGRRAHLCRLRRRSRGRVLQSRRLRRAREAQRLAHLSPPIRGRKPVALCPWSYRSQADRRLHPHAPAPTLPVSGTLAIRPASGRGSWTG